MEPNLVGHGKTFFFAAAALLVLLFSPLANAQVIRTGYTSIVAANSGKCVDISGQSTVAGVAAIQWHCNSQSNEAWTV